MWIKNVFIFTILTVAIGDGVTSLVCPPPKDSNEPTCDDYMCELFTSFQQNRTWALKMLDSMSKIPPGILDGNLQGLGAFDECVEIEGQSERLGVIYGKYCLGKVTVQNIPLSFAVCVPHKCSADNLSPFVKKYVTGVDDVQFTDDFCQSIETQPDYTLGDYLAIAFFAFIQFLIIVSTIYDLVHVHFGLVPKYEILLAYSIWTNWKKLFAVHKNKNDDHLDCLAGIRTISMMWIILGHGYSTKSLGGISNAAFVNTWYNEPSTMYIASATVSVDSFFLLSGVVLVYVYMKTPISGNILLKTLLMYLHRYIRLTPSLTAILIVHTTFLKHMGSGPFWPRIYTYMINFCQEWWWSVLLYVQNYVNSDQECLGQSWYLSVDMQLFLLSPIILIPMKRHPKPTVATLVGLIGISMAGIFYISYHYNLRALDLSGIGDILTKYYVTTHTRAPPYLIGMLLGYYIYKCKFVYSSFKINRTLNIILWVASLTVLCLCTFLGSDLLNAEVYDKNVHSAYLTFHRPSWALALSWIIFACVTGYGGPVNTFLSMPIFQILSRLTYSMYLVHYTYITVVVLSQRSPTRVSHSLVMTEFWSNYSITLCLATILTLSFESPIITLEKCIKKMISGKLETKSTETITETLTVVLQKVQPVSEEVSQIAKHP